MNLISKIWPDVCLKIFLRSLVHIYPNLFIFLFEFRVDVFRLYTCINLKGTTINHFQKKNNDCPIIVFLLKKNSTAFSYSLYMTLLKKKIKKRSSSQNCYLYILRSYFSGSWWKRVLNIRFLENSKKKGI